MRDDLRRADGPARDIASAFAKASADKPLIRATTVPSHQLQRRIVNQAKADPADQFRTARLGLTDGRLGLPQRADIRSERHDAAKHEGNRSEGRGLAGSEQAEHRDHQQCKTAGDRGLRAENDPARALGALGELLTTSNAKPPAIAAFEPRMILRERSALSASSSIRASISEMSSVGSLSVITSTSRRAG